MRYELKSDKPMNGIPLATCFSQEISTSHMKNSKTNLYLKGLPSTFCDEDILNLAPTKSSVRSVKAAVEDDKKCKGYGFIDFLTPEDAKSGMAYIQEKNPGFSIKYAKENEKDKTNLYVTNLPKSWTSKDSEKLKTLFERFGVIQSAFIMLEKYGNKPLGVGFVRFFNEEAAYKAIVDLETNPLYASAECNGPLEAKYADKHVGDTKRKYSVTKTGSTSGSVSNSPHNHFLSALLDDSYTKSPFLCPIPQTNINDVYNQYLINLTQFGLMDQYCFLPTIVAGSPANYLNSYGDSTSHVGNFFPNLVYPFQSNIQVDPVTSSNPAFVVPTSGLVPRVAGVPLVQTFNQII